MKSGDITGVMGVPELTWCYNCNSGLPTPHGPSVCTTVSSYSPSQLLLSILILTGSRYETGRMGRVSHMEFQEQIKGLKLEWGIEKSWIQSKDLWEQK